MPYNPWEANSLQRAADFEERQSSGASIEDSVIDYVTKGTASALTSAGVGIWNSVKGMYNTLGGDTQYTSEERVVRDLFGSDTSSFYMRHKQGADVAGLLAGSITAGGAFLKGFHMLQKAGKVTMGMEAATGLANPVNDIVLGSRQVQIAKEAAKANPITFSWNNRETWNAIGTGAKQAMTEAFIFDAAAGIFNANNIVVNPDNQSYLDSLWSYTKETVPFTIAGGALGTAITGLQIKGAVGRAYKEESLKYSHLTGIMAGLPEYGNKGNLLALGLGKLLELYHSPDYAIEAGNKFGLARKAAAEEQLVSYITTNFTEINKAGQEGLGELNKLISGVKEGRMTPEKLAQDLAGMTSLSNFGMRDFEQMSRFFSKTVAPTVFSEAKNFETSIDQAKSYLLAGVHENDAFTWDFINGYMEEIRRKAYLPNGPGNANHGGYMRGEQEHIKNWIQAFGDTFTKNPIEEIGYIAGEGHAFTGDMAQFHATFQQRIKMFEDNLIRHGVMKDYVFGNVTQEEMQKMIELHEITHFKTNPVGAVKSVRYHVANGTELGNELETFSRMLYPDYWGNFDDAVQTLMKTRGWDYKKAKKVLYQDMVGKQGLSRIDENYGYRPVEIIAQAAEFIMHPEYAEQAARLAPKTVKFFNKWGAYIKPYDPKVAYRNIRTGEEYTGILPLPQDLGKVTMKGASIRIAGTEFGHVYDSQIFNPQKVKEMFVEKDAWKISNLDRAYMKAASMFTAIGAQKWGDFVNDIITKEGRFLIGKYDLPRMERLVVEGRKGMPFPTILVDMSDNAIPKLETVTLDDVEKMLIAGKKQMQFALTTQYMHNEQMIAHALNIETRNATNIVQEGVDNNAGLIVMDKRNYTSPEHIVVKYDPIEMKTLGESARSMAAIQQRMDMMRELRMRNAAEIVGADVSQLPSTDLVAKVTPNLDETASRAGVFNNVRAQVGKLGLRELAQSTGRVVRGIIGKKAQEIEESFSRHYAIFNNAKNPNSVKLRMELAMATNKLYEGWHNNFTVLVDEATGEQRHLLISLDELAQHKAIVEGWATDANAGNLTAKKELQLLMDSVPNGSKLTSDELALILAERNKKTLKLSKEVNDFFEDCVKPFNSEVTRKHSLIAQAKGLVSTWRNDVLYPPPRNLTKSPHIAFVLPRGAQEGADAGRYMLYGKTAKELEVKMQAAKEKYGQTHRVVTQNNEITEYKKLIGEYDKGEVFDEWFFDPSLTRKGRAAEAVPSLDIEASEVLDRFRNWQHRTSEHQIRSGVELMYQPTMSFLERASNVYGKAARANIMGRSEKSDIFEDTRNLFLDKSSQQGVGAEMYKKVSGLVSEKGGQLIDSIVSKATVGTSGRLTEESWAKMNKELEEAGFNPPYSDMMRAIAASPDTSNSRSLELIVRTMNNLAGTFQLRLDWANSMLQSISTPILTLPVIREAMRNSQDVYDLMHVPNPAAGRLEPSPMKVFWRAIKSFWSKEGKADIEEMRKRGILTDYLKEYLEAQDFSQLTGRHSLKTLNDTVTKMGEFGSKWSLHRFSEDFSRYVVAASIKDIAKLRGLGEEETWALVSNAVDAVHGIYRAHQRPQVFNGVIGQAIGMYQTYMFNWAQNALKFVADGDKKNAAIMAAMQGSIFGLRSFPGFTTLNNQIASTNSGQLDMYTATDANDPNSWASWFMYGLGSHALGYPIDFASRGDITVRNMLVLPTDVQSIPAVQIIGNTIGNMIKVGEMVANNDTSVGNALLFGLAHNGLSRPLQGLGTTLMGEVTTKQGTPLFVNSNHTDYDAANELNLGMITSRIIGTRPLHEAILLDDMYRQRGYQANVKQQIAEIGTEIRLAVSNGAEVSGDQWDAFATRYEKAGGKIENFNAFAGQMLSASTKSSVLEFRDKLQEDSPLTRARDRMLIERENVSPEE